MKFLRLLAVALCVASPALAETNPGTSPLSIAKGGTSAATAAAARTALGLLIGTNVQAWDADLDAVAALACTGSIVRTASNTVTCRTITGTAAEITVTNGDGVAGVPTLSLPAALTFTGKTITGGTFNSPSLVTPALGTTTITSSSANSLTVGPNGATNPVLQIVSSTVSQANGLSITGSVSGSGVNLATASSATNDGIVINAKGTGTIVLGNVSTGAISATPQFNGTVLSASTGYRVSNAATSTHVLRGNGTNFVDAALAPSDLSPGAFAKVVSQTFCPSGCTTTIASGGSGTYTPTTGILYAIIKCVGGGGAGGSITGPGAGNAEGSPGGGAGNYSESIASAATIGASQTVTIGALGAAGAAGNNAGGNGGDTSVGSICIGKGATGGSFGGLSAGGAGGVSGTGNVVTIVGQNGEAGKYFHVGGANPYSGAGASSPFGAGAAPSLGNGSTVAGNAGIGNGSGGSGASSQAVATTGAGGAGTAGKVVITEFVNQ